MASNMVGGVKSAQDLSRLFFREEDVGVSNVGDRATIKMIPQARTPSSSADTEASAADTAAASSMHTYSAGEDGGRLASLAASLGLEHHRQPTRWRQGVSRKSRGKESPSSSFDADPPSRTESDVSSDEDDSSVASAGSFFIEDQVERNPNVVSGRSPCNAKVPKVTTTAAAKNREPLQWEFHGLTLWLELEEFDMDLSNAIQDAAATHGVRPIPKSHTTAIYGMGHLTKDEAIARLRSVPARLPSGRWPSFSRPVGVVQDIAVNGNPGQVCSIAWAELTLPSSPEHELALDTLYEIFYPDCGPVRHRPWKPHNSIVYDNPEETVLTLVDTIQCVTRHPTLLSMGRRVEAISLWDTNGTMADWKCLDRVCFD